MEIEQIEHEIKLSWKVSTSVTSSKAIFIPIHIFHEEDPGRTRIYHDEMEHVSCELNKRGLP